MDVELKSGSDAVFCVSGGLLMFWESPSQGTCTLRLGHGRVEEKGSQWEGDVNTFAD